MPYEVAGNAAAGDFDDRYGGNSSGIIKPAPVNSYVNYSNIQVSPSPRPTPLPLP